jgi:hypothetical protein
MSLLSASVPVKSKIGVVSLVLEVSAGLFKATVGEAEELGDALGLIDGLRERLTDGLTDGLRDADADGEREGLAEIDDDGLGETEGLRDSEGAVYNKA